MAQDPREYDVRKQRSRWFRRLPADVQDEMLEQIYRAILWRSHDRNRHSHAADAIQNIVAMGEAAGLEFEEYT